jgi:hypothetical protein
MNKIETLASFDHDQKFEGKTIEDILPFLKPEFRPNKHSDPCPKQTTEDISKCPLVNEWVLNHLALSEDQKARLIPQLQMDQMKDRSSEKRQRWKTVIRKPHITQSTDSHKVSVKELTKQ